MAGGADYSQLFKADAQPCSGIAVAACTLTLWTLPYRAALDCAKRYDPVLVASDTPKKGNIPPSSTFSGNRVIRRAAGSVLQSRL